MSNNAELDEDVASEKQQPSSAMKAKVQRLGILQLGWHAHEKSAPSKIQKLMTIDNAIKVPHMIPLLARASEQDSTVQIAYLCHPCVEHITKQKGEGSFCGYRNIQMMISFIIGSNGIGANIFNDEIPSIIGIQEMIEDAWDRGINSEGRIETGGIRGTRKHIGTPEVQTLFKGIGVPCSVGSYVTSSSGKGAGRKAFDLLLDYVEDYFSTKQVQNRNSKVCVTTMPPIYLQRPHHSMTITGIETRSDGKRNLLVLDQQVNLSEKVMKAAEAVDKGMNANETTIINLKAYRRGKWDLGLYKEFETLALDT